MCFQIKLERCFCVFSNRAQAFVFAAQFSIALVSIQDNRLRPPCKATIFALCSSLQHCFVWIGIVIAPASITPLHSGSQQLTMQILGAMRTQVLTHMTSGMVTTRLENTPAMEVLPSPSLLLPCLADAELALHEGGLHGQPQVHHVL